jgi:hypothetical protein
METAPPTDLKSVSIRDEVDTIIGKLQLPDGVPTGETIKALYDNHDRSRDSIT